MRPPLAAIALGLLLSAVACTRVVPGGSQAAAQGADASSHPTMAPGQLQLLLGHVLPTPDGLAFRPCGQEELRRASDPSGILQAIQAELFPAQEGLGELFVVVEGEVAGSPSRGGDDKTMGALRVRKVLYAGAEGPDCQMKWEGFRYRASGNEPFWSAWISSRVLRVTRLGAGELIWPEVYEEHREDARRFTASRLGEQPRAVLEILPAACRDSMSGAYFGFSGRLRVGEDALFGCVLQGKEPEPR